MYGGISKEEIQVLSLTTLEKKNIFKAKKLKRIISYLLHETIIYTHNWSL